MPTNELVEMIIFHIPTKSVWKQKHPLQKRHTEYVSANFQKCIKFLKSYFNILYMYVCVCEYVWVC